MAETVEVESIALGDEVVYQVDQDQWIPAEIVGITADELVLSCRLGHVQITQRSTHGPHLHGWLTYNQAAKTILRA